MEVPQDDVSSCKSSLPVSIVSPNPDFSRPNSTKNNSHSPKSMTDVTSNPPKSYFTKNNSATSLQSMKNMSTFPPRSDSRRDDYKSSFRPNSTNNKGDIFYDESNPTKDNSSSFSRPNSTKDPATRKYLGFPSKRMEIEPRKESTNGKDVTDLATNEVNNTKINCVPETLDDVATMKTQSKQRNKSGKMTVGNYTTTAENQTTNKKTSNKQKRKTEKTRRPPIIIPSAIVNDDTEADGSGDEETVSRESCSDESIFSDNETEYGDWCDATDVTKSDNETPQMKLQTLDEKVSDTRTKVNIVSEAFEYETRASAPIFSNSFSRGKREKQQPLPRSFDLSLAPLHIEKSRLFQRQASCNLIPTAATSTRTNNQFGPRLLVRRNTTSMASVPAYQWIDCHNLVDANGNGSYSSKAEVFFASTDPITAVSFVNNSDKHPRTQVPELSAPRNTAMGTDDSQLVTESFYLAEYHIRHVDIENPIVIKTINPDNEQIKSFNQVAGQNDLVYKNGQFEISESNLETSNDPGEDVQNKMGLHILPSDSSHQKSRSRLLPNATSTVYSDLETRTESSCSLSPYLELVSSDVRIPSGQSEGIMDSQLEMGDENTTEINGKQGHEHDRTCRPKREKRICFKAPESLINEAHSYEISLRPNIDPQPNVGVFERKSKCENRVLTPFSTETLQTTPPFNKHYNTETGSPKHSETETSLLSNNAETRTKETHQSNSSTLPNLHKSQIIHFNPNDNLKICRSNLVKKDEEKLNSDVRTQSSMTSEKTDPLVKESKNNTRYSEASQNSEGSEGYTTDVRVSEENQITPNIHVEVRHKFEDFSKPKFNCSPHKGRQRYRPTRNAGCMERFQEHQSECSIKYRQFFDVEETRKVVVKNTLGPAVKCREVKFTLPEKPHNKKTIFNNKDNALTKKNHCGYELQLNIKDSCKSVPSHTTVEESETNCEINANGIISDDVSYQKEQELTAVCSCDNDEKFHVFIQPPVNDDPKQRDINSVSKQMHTSKEGNHVNKPLTESFTGGGEQNQTFLTEPLVDEFDSKHRLSVYTSETSRLSRERVASVVSASGDGQKTPVNSKSLQKLFRDFSHSENLRDSFTRLGCNQHDRTVPRRHVCFRCLRLKTPMRCRREIGTGNHLSKSSFERDSGSLKGFRLNQQSALQKQGEISGEVLINSTSNRHAFDTDTQWDNSAKDFNFEDKFEQRNREDHNMGMCFSEVMKSDTHFPKEECRLMLPDVTPRSRSAPSIKGQRRGCEIERQMDEVHFQQSPMTERQFTDNEARQLVHQLRVIHRSRQGAFSKLFPPFRNKGVAGVHVSLPSAARVRHSLIASLMAPHAVTSAARANQAHQWSEEGIFLRGSNKPIIQAPSPPPRPDISICTVEEMTRLAQYGTA